MKTNRHLFAWLEQTATLLSQHYNLAESQQILVRQNNRECSPIAAQILRTLESGQPLHMALNSLNAAIEPATLAVLAAGERSAQLPQAMMALVAAQQAENARWMTLRNALTYPLVLLGSALVVVLGLFDWVIPGFKPLVGPLTDLDPWNRWIYQMAGQMGTTYRLAALVLLSIAALSIMIKRVPLLSRGLSRTLCSFPRTREKLVGWYKVAFMQQLALTLRGGVDLQNALQLSVAAITNASLRDWVNQQFAALRQGQSLSGVLRSAQLLTPAEAHRLSIADGRGRLINAVGEIADNAKRSGEQRVAKLTALLTPVATVALGLLVLAIALAILLPVLSLQSDFT